MKNKFLSKFKSSSVLLAVLIIVLVVAVFSLWKNSHSLLPALSGATPKPTVTNSSISPEMKKFGLKIDKIGVLAPVVRDVDGTSKYAYNKALEKGVAHYKGTSTPGNGSNIFIFGHSSTILGKGDYATIFAKLNDLEKGDEIMVYFEDKIYKYAVSKKEIVEKDDTSVLESTKKEQLTLMTCWPIGTNLKRLVVYASPVYGDVGDYKK